jgi:hypothetical protein
MVSVEYLLNPVVASIHFLQIQDQFAPKVDPIWSQYKAYRCDECGEYRNWFIDICRVCTAPPAYKAPPRSRPTHQVRPRRQYQDDYFEYKNYKSF